MAFIFDDGKPPLDPKRVDGGVWFDCPFISPGARVKLRYSDDEEGHEPYAKAVRKLYTKVTEKSLELRRATADERVIKERQSALEGDWRKAWAQLYAKLVIVDHQNIRYYASAADHRARRNPRELPKTPEAWSEALRESDLIFNRLRKLSETRKEFEINGPMAEMIEVEEEGPRLTLEELLVDLDADLDRPELPSWLSAAQRESLLAAEIRDAASVKSAGVARIKALRGLGEKSAKRLVTWAEEEDPQEDPLGST